MFKECLYITISAVQSFIKVLIYMNKTQSGCWMVTYESLKTEEKSSLVILKVVAVAYESFSWQSLSQSSNGISQGGRNQGWSLTRVVTRRASTIFGQNIPSTFFLLWDLLTTVCQCNGSVLSLV